MQPANIAIQLVDSPLVLVAAALLAVAAIEFFFRLLMRLGRRWTDRNIALVVANRCWWPARFLLPAVACDLALPFARLPESEFQLVQHLLTLAIIGTSAWLVVALSFALEDTASVRYRIDVRDNLHARRVRTRVTVIRRITVGLVAVIALAAMLTTFQGALALGASLLASAGIAAVVVGVAARPTISNLVAGLQIMVSEALRVDDVVVIEGEWGRVEEIKLTYLVVRLWDERRMVLPLVYIVDRPFQNWTRHTASIMAPVYIRVDYTTQVEELRRELGRILATSTLWDRRFWNLQVTDVTKDGIELRALMTAGDAPEAWDLGCEVREKLVAFIQLGLPGAVPRRRVEIPNADGQRKREGFRGGVHVG